MHMHLSHPIKQPAVALFVLLIGIYAYFYQAGGANQNTRFDLVRSMIEEHSLQIDHYQHNTVDKAQRGQHYYTDKAPGVSWLGLPVHEAVVSIAGSLEKAPSLNISMYLLTLFVVALPSALATVMLLELGRLFDLSLKTSIVIALAYGLGTLAFPYSTLYYGHQLSAALLLGAFAMLVRLRHRDTAPPSANRLFAIGLMLGYSIVTEYPAALACAVLFLYAVQFVRPRKLLLWLAFGVAIPGGALALYHYAAFGGPLILPYEYSTQPHRHLGFFMGIGLPNMEVIYQILFSSYRGLFFSSPWLLLAIPGSILLWRKKHFRVEMLVCIAIVLQFIWLNSSLVDWEGGGTMGPRYLIPAIPFLAVMTIGIFETLQNWLSLPVAQSGMQSAAGLLPLALLRRAAALTACLVMLGISLFNMLVATAVGPQVAMKIMHPFKEALYPLFFSGDLAINFDSVDGIPFQLLATDRMSFSLDRGCLTITDETGNINSFVSHASNAGQLLGLDGLASLLPLLLFTLLAGNWLWHTIRRQAG